MRFNIIAAFLAFSSPMLSLAAPSPQAGSVSPGSVLSIINDLQTTIKQFENNINSTIASLGASPNASEKAAASQIFNTAAQAITSAITEAVGAIGSQAKGAVATRDVAAGTVDDLVPAVSDVITMILGTLGTVLPVLDLGSAGSFILQLISALTSLATTIAQVFGEIEPLIVPILNAATAALNFVSSILKLIP